METITRIYGKPVGPSFNSFHGTPELKAEGFVLRKPVDGWFDTLRMMDMDIRTRLPVGTKVNVWFAERSQTWILTCKAPIREFMGTAYKDDDRLFDFTAKIKSEDVEMATEDDEPETCDECGEEITDGDCKACAEKEELDEIEELKALIGDAKAQEAKEDRM